TAAGDPEVKAALLDTVKQLQKVIDNPDLPAQVRERAKEVVETVQQIVVEAPDAGVDTGEEGVPEEAPSEAPSASAAH
ncbi:MAG: hypothetical protein ACRDKS_06620, partial [Actinomycetota bacterium]